jgi:hypothetical protein
VARTVLQLVRDDNASEGVAENCPVCRRIETRGRAGRLTTSVREVRAAAPTPKSRGGQTMDAYRTAGSSPPEIEVDAFVPDWNGQGPLLRFTPHTVRALVWLSQNAPFNSAWFRTAVIMGPGKWAEEIYEKLVELEVIKVVRR